MDDTSPSPATIPLAFSEIVSHAAMSLPPLTRPQDMEFLRKMTEVVMDAFWQNYVHALPQKAQEEFRAVFEMKDDAEMRKAVEQWFANYANFRNDQIAEEKGRALMQELAEKLPAIMQQEYELFTEEDMDTL